MPVGLGLGDGTSSRGCDRCRSELTAPRFSCHGSAASHSAALAAVGLGVAGGRQNFWGSRERVGACFLEAFGSWPRSALSSSLTLAGHCPSASLGFFLCKRWWWWSWGAGGGPPSWWAWAQGSVFSISFPGDSHKWSREPQARSLHSWSLAPDKLSSLSKARKGKSTCWEAPWPAPRALHQVPPRIP